jgi:hypothetical protein
MLDTEIEEPWRAVKESYPDAVVFHEGRGLFVVKGRDVEVLSREFGIESGSTWFGFDDCQALGYMTELAKRGYAVVSVSSGRVSHVKPPADRRRRIQRQRAEGRFLAVEPTLLFDRREIERVTSGRWLRQRGYEELLGSFERWLQGGDWHSLRDYGEVYVYPVGDWYEVDLELTSMLEGHVLLLAKAALATERKLPCHVVEPQRRRNGHRSRRSRQTVAQDSQTPRLGQLSFGDLDGGWTR